MLFDMRTISIRTKIIGLIVGAVTCVVGVLLAIYAYDQRSQMREREARLIQDSIKSAAGLAYTVTPHFVESDYAFMNGLATHYARRAYRSYVMVVDNQNRILARSTEAELGDVFEIPAGSKAKEIGEGLFQQYVREGKTFYDVSYPIKAGDLVLGKVRIGLNTDWIGKEKEEMTKTILEFIGVALAVTIVSILGASAMTRKMTGPLLRLAQITKDVGKGDYTRMVDIKSNDEVGMFADAFNVMIGDLSRSRAQLVDKLYVDSIMAAMEDCLIVLTPEGLIATVNKCALDLLGYRRAELVNRSVEVIVDEWLFSPEAIDDVTNRALLSNSVEGTFRSKAGRKIPMLLSVSAMGGESAGGLLLVGKDITERKRAEEALRASKEKLLMLFDSASDGIFILDLEGNFMDVNRTGYERLGYTKAEMLSMKISEIDPPDFAVRVPDRLAQIKERGNAVFESAHRRKDGTIMDVEVNSRVLDLEGREVLFSVIRDITERKQIAEALKESERRYHILFEQSPDGILLIDTSGKIIEFNETAHRQLGYPREEFADLSLSDIDPVESDAQRRVRIEKILREGKAEFDVRQKTKQGELRDVRIITQAITLSGKQVLHTIWHDITERKRAEDAIIRSEKRFRALFDNTTLGIAIVDLNRQFVDCNPSFQRMLGYSMEELTSMTVHQVSYADDDAKSRAYYEAMLNGNKDSFSIEKRYIRKDGTLFWSNMTGTLIRDEDDSPHLLFGIVEDIADRKQAEEQIRAALHEKEILLKEIHHRVKNNLQVVSSMLRLQADYIADDSARAFFDASRTRVETMSLIHEKLYRAKDLARIDFREYVDDLATNLSIINTRRVGHAEVKIDVEGIMLDVNNSIPCGLIINELVSNAFKHAFTDGRRGEVTISMRRNNEKRIVLAVSDNGMGFPGDIDFRNTSSLGLQLVNSLVTQLGGTIAMDRSGGTTFRIEFEA